MPNGSADAAAGAPNPESYTDNGDGTVTDNVTKLMWQQNVAPTKYTWANASAYCATLTLAGHADWRLPSIIELISIIEPAAAAPNAAVNATAFPGAPGSYVWSSTAVPGAPSVWCVVFAEGTVYTTSATSTTVDSRCVR